MNEFQGEIIAQQLYDMLQKEAEGMSATYSYTKAHEEQFKNIDVETLVCDDYFLGLKNFIFPQHLEDIKELWKERKKRPINLALFEQSIGAGKSFTASILIWLQWFEVATIYNPQEHFGLAPGTTIAFMTMSRTEMQARRVIFTDVWKRFQSPFNKDYFPPNPRYQKEIQISQNNTVVYAGTSSELSALGYNLFGACIDEANFLEVVEGSKKADHKEVYDAAEAMYNAVMNRMVSRFMVAGEVPGFIVMISSRKSRDSFMEKKIKEAVARQGDPTLPIFYKVHSLWDAKPDKFFPSKKYFYIDTDTFEKLDPTFGAKLYNLQIKLLERKKRLRLLEPEDIGLVV
jgi:hypothetical protein